MQEAGQEGEQGLPGVSVEQTEAGQSGASSGTWSALGGQSRGKVGEWWVTPRQSEEGLCQRHGSHQSVVSRKVT